MRSFVLLYVEISFFSRCVEKKIKKIWCNDGFGNGIKVVMVVDGVVVGRPHGFWPVMVFWWFLSFWHQKDEAVHRFDQTPPLPYTKMMWTWWRKTKKLRLRLLDSITYIRVPSPSICLEKKLWFHYCSAARHWQWQGMPHMLDLSR
jgi:hypothetical protein